jgi:hypothetical protein
MFTGRDSEVSRVNELNDSETLQADEGYEFSWERVAVGKGLWERGLWERGLWERGLCY